MGTFINNDMTVAGLLVLAKGIAGQKINFTRIVMGDGYLEEGQMPRTLEGVISPQATISISKLKICENGTVVVGGVFTNKDEDNGFYYRELGLYADDPEAGEVLYCYGNSGDLAEWIPPTGGSTVLEKTIDIITAIGTAANVTAYISPDAYFTVKQFEEFKAAGIQASTLGGKTADDFAEAVHTHDDRYYTETEVDSKLSGKANSSHTHTASQVTGLPTSLPANGGSADTAEKLKTARNINGVAFDGSKDITVTAAANGGDADTVGGAAVMTTSALGLHKMASGTAAPTSATCPAGCWYGQYE